MMNRSIACLLGLLITTSAMAGVTDRNYLPSFFVQGLQNRSNTVPTEADLHIGAHWYCSKHSMNTNQVGFSDPETYELTETQYVLSSRMYFMRIEGQIVDQAGWNARYDRRLGCMIPITRASQTECFRKRADGALFFESAKSVERASGDHSVDLNPNAILSLGMKATAYGICLPAENQ